MDFLAIFIFLSVTLISAFYIYIKKCYEYWKIRGVPYEEPVFPYGSFKGVQKTVSVVDFMTRIYNLKKDNSPIVGLFVFASPAIIATDLEFIKNILIKDFNYFTDHGLFYNEKDDPISANLFMLDGNDWRTMRNKLSPTFTSGKIKSMFETMDNVGIELSEAIKNMLKTENTFNIKTLMEQYTTNVIGSCAFGIDCNSFKNPDTEFRVYGRKAFLEKRYNEIIEVFLMKFPNLGRKLRFKVMVDDVSKFFMNVVKDTIEYREKHNIVRNDFLNILLQLKKTNNDDDNNDKLTVNQIAAQLMIFFFAGFETSSSLMTFCLYELALNPDIQEKLRDEINEVTSKHNGNITYESIKEMKYLEQVINETLRKYPPSSNLIRKAVKDYKIPNSDLTIEKNTMILVPVYSIHNDSQYYDKPEIFDPERFNPENIKSRLAASFLPFGDGPRNCIAFRFGLMQVRVGIIHLIKNFYFHNTSLNQNPIEFDVKAPLLSAKNGIHLKTEKIQ